MATINEEPDLPIPDNQADYRVGTLQYTKATLAALFGWLILGDLSFKLFESSGGAGASMTLFLQDNFHLSNFGVNILFNFIPLMIGTVMTPIVSFRSDRTRGRMGRRIPYILFTMPFLVVFAAALGFADEIIGYCKAHFSASGVVTPFMLALLVIGFLTIGFSFFNEFVGTVYYYLLPDVMPRKFLGRFQGVSQMGGLLAGIFINAYIFPYQLTYLKWIHVGVAALYLVSFSLVCWRVKEGEYPPVEDVGRRTSFVEKIGIYFRECFTHPIFICFYLVSAAPYIAKGTAPAGIFGLHLSEHQGSAIAADNGQPASLAMSADGSRTLSGGEPGTLKVWDTGRGHNPKMLRTFSAIDTIHSVALSPDGKIAACGEADGHVEMWDTATGHRTFDIVVGAGSINSIAFSDDSSLLATGGADQRVTVWDAATGNLVKVFVGQSGAVNAVAFARASDDKLVSGGADGEVIVWTLRTPWGLSNPFIGSPARVLSGSPGPVYAVCFAPKLVPVNQSTGNVAKYVWVTMTNFLHEVFSNESMYSTPPDRNCKIVAEDQWVVAGGRDGERDNEYAKVRIWDLTDGTMKSLKGHKQAIYSVVYKPDLRVILTGSVDGSVRLWKPLETDPKASDQSYKTFSGYTNTITSLASPTGPLMITSGRDGVLHFWDIDQGISLLHTGHRNIFFNILMFILAFPIGWMVDKTNPIRITIIMHALLIPFALLNFFFLHDFLFGTWMMLFTTPLTMASSMANVPMRVVIFPRSKYGQMASADALVKQFVGAVFGLFGAWLMDRITRSTLNTDNYRYGYLFQFGTSAIALFFLIMVYRYWKKMGGVHYVPPERDPLPVVEPAAAAEPA